MPEFTNAFSGLDSTRKLNGHELVRAVRFMIAAEYEAIQLYEQLEDSTENALARKVLHDIIDEEKEHVGEFRHLLSLLVPEDEEAYEKGRQEAETYLAPLLTGDGFETGEAGSCGYRPGCNRPEQG